MPAASSDFKSEITVRPEIARGPMTDEPKAPHLILLKSPDEHLFSDMEIRTMMHVGASALGANVFGARGVPSHHFHPVLRDEIIIGRSSACDIVLNHVTVSRRHFAIRKSGALVKIEDLGGASGTRLNGEEIAEETALHDGDQIAAGRYTFLFSWK